MYHSYSIQCLKNLNICAVVLHIQTTAAIPFRPVVEGEREREGMKWKQGQLRVKIGLGLPSI